MDDKNEASLVNSSSSSRCVYFTNKCPEGSSSSQLLWRLNIVMACANKEPQHWVTRGQSMEDDYRVIQWIGKGSYGAVWEVTNKTTGKQFACKLMFKKKMHNIHHEARVLAHLGNHPNVTKLVDIYEDKDCLYLIMELCKGGTLLDYVHRSNYIPERDLATICFQITSALLLFKERGLVHADLKLENTLLVSPTELSIKVADFGLSHFCKEGEQIRGVYCGTDGYLAPEICKSFTFDTRADIFSLGVIIYRLVDMERFPKPSLTGQQLEDFEDLHGDDWEWISVSAKLLIQRMLMEDPAERPTLEEILCKKPQLWKGFYVKEKPNYNLLDCEIHHLPL